MSEVSNTPTVQQPGNATSTPVPKEPLERRKFLDIALSVLIFAAVFVLAAVINWNIQRRTAILGSDVAEFESALQGYVAIALEHGEVCLDFAYNEQGKLVIGDPFFSNKSDGYTADVNAAASRLYSAATLFSGENQSLAIRRINTVIYDANDKLESEVWPRAPTPDAVKNLSEQKNYFLGKAFYRHSPVPEAGRVGPNAPWKTDSLAAVVFAVGWRSALAAVIAATVFWIVSLVLLSGWGFFLNRIRELARAARGLP